MTMSFLLTEKRFCIAAQGTDFYSGGRAAAPFFLLLAQKKEGKEKGTLLTRPDGYSALRVPDRRSPTRFAQTRLARILPATAMLDALGGFYQGAESNRLQPGRGEHLWEPSPLGEKFARGAGSCAKTGKGVNCDLRATERRRPNREQEAVCLSIASLRPRLFDRVREGTRRVVRRPLQAIHGIAAFVHPCTAERMVLVTFA